MELVPHPTKPGWLIGTPEILAILADPNYIEVGEGQVVHQLHFTPVDFELDDQADIDAWNAEQADIPVRAQVVADLNNELAWLDSTIPAIGTMTNVQVRDVVKRLAQENRGVIRILVWLAKQLNS